MPTTHNKPTQNGDRTMAAKHKGKTEMTTTKQALEASTALLNDLYDYAAYIRRQVLNDPRTAMKGGFTYIDLDTLDEVMVQMSVNHKVLGTKKPARKKK